MFLLPKTESMFSIITALDKIEYEFKNRVVFEMPEKLVIVVTNPLVCYLIVKMIYARLLLIIMLMFISIKFEVPGEAIYTYDGPTKPGRET